MYIINFTKLIPGDILLTRSDDRVSQIIRNKTKSEYSHASLYVSQSSYIHSNVNGVCSENIQNILLKNSDDAVVLRLKKNEYLIPKAIEFARLSIGTEYDLDEAKKVGQENDYSTANANRQFCTRFVAKAYEYAGLHLVEDPEYCSAQQLLQSSELMLVNDITIPAMEEDIKRINSGSYLTKQTSTTEKVFMSVRKLLKNDVQTFDQLIEVLIQKPEFDREVVDIFKEFKYWELWKLETAQNPYLYDVSRMLAYKIPIEEKIRLCSDVLSSEYQESRRFEVLADQFEILYVMYGLQFFKLNVPLYDTLINLSEKKRFVAEQMISIYSNPFNIFKL